MEGLLQKREILYEENFINIILSSKNGQCTYSDDAWGKCQNVTDVWMEELHTLMTRSRWQPACVLSSQYPEHVIKKSGGGWMARLLTPSATSKYTHFQIEMLGLQATRFFFNIFRNFRKLFVNLTIRYKKPKVHQNMNVVRVQRS